MTRPGTLVTLRDAPSTISLPTDTGTAFMVGLADRGPLAASSIFSLQDFINTLGTRQSYSPLYDAVETYFREGGDHAYIGRVVGPGATLGTRNLLDGGAGISLVANANGPGAWSANYKVAVVSGVAGGTFRIQVTDTAGNVLEDSGDLATQIAAVQWSQFSNYIRIVLGVTGNNPVNVAATALSAGTDDRASITDAQWLAALNFFPSDLGPGQVLAPGSTTATRHQQLIDHATANNRVALFDISDSATKGTLEADVSAYSSRFAAAFSPWAVIPGITGVATTRTAPMSAAIAGLIARNDPGLGPNRPSAGNAGVLRFVTGLSQPGFSESDRTELNVNGVNLVRSMFNGIRVYGWRSLADPVTDSNWLDFANARLYMSLTAELKVVAENFVFEEIDGQNGETIGSFHSAIAGILLEHYNRGELFGDTADQAFSVDTSAGVNTLQTIANQELHAVCAIKMSPMAEYVVIEVVKVPVSQNL